MRSLLSIKKYQFVTLLAIFLFTFVFLSTGKTEVVYANCGADGAGPHGYAGLIVDVKIQRKVNGVNTYIEGLGGTYNINTLGPEDGAEYPAPSSGGNVINLNTNQRFDSATFTQIANSCSGNEGSQSIVLGYNTTSQPQNGTAGSWALDCDLSKHPGSTQKFRITGLEAPSNAQPGKWQDSIIVGPANGGTAKVQLLWVEDLPDPNFKVNIDIVNCSIIRWTTTGAPNPKYRIVYAIDNDNNATVGSGGVTGVDRNVILGYWTHGNGTYQASIDPSVTRVPWRAYVQVATAYNPSGVPTSWQNLGNIYYPAGSSTAPRQECNPPNNRLDFSVGLNCSSLTISGISDPDIGLVDFTYSVYEAGTQRLIKSQYVQGHNKNLPFNSSFSFTDTDNSNQGVYVTVTMNDRNSLGNYVGSVTKDSSATCYIGSCSINSVVSNVPGIGAGPNAVRAGEDFTINYTVRDTDGELAVPNNALSLTMRSPVANWTNNGGGYTQFSSGPGRVRDGTLTLRAPTNVQSTELRFYADWAGRFGISLSDCTVTVNIYRPYDITPTNQGVTLNPDAETPTSATLASGISNSGQAVNNVTVTRSIQRKIGTNVTVLPNNLVSTYNNIGSNNDPHTVNIPQPVDSSHEYCGTITVSPAAGWVGTGSLRTITENIRSAGPSCDSVDNLPYMKVYGGDVVSGAATLDSTSGSCVSPAQGGIAAFMRPATENAAAGKSGSGSQYATFSYGGTTNGFASAMLRGTAPAASGVNKLTFANTASPIGAGLSPELGPQFNGSRPCLDDYFTKGQYSNTNDSSSVISESNVTSLSLSGLAFNKQTLISYPDAGVSADVTLSGGEGYASRHTVFVDGDARISTNIVYAAETATSTTTGDVRDRPSFTLIVRGNIYIDPGVSRLDGTYIAQKRAGSATDTGKIYTCAPNGAAITSSDLTQRFSACGANSAVPVPQLKVYGSFVADQLVLGRTMGSVRDSGFQENQDVTRAAEVFVFMPDYYISKPVVRPAGTITSGDYEYLAKLPPIL